MSATRRLIVLSMVCALALAGCKQAEPTAAPPAPTEAPTAAPAEATEPPPEPTSTTAPTATLEPTATPTATPTSVPTEAPTETPQPEPTATATSVPTEPSTEVPTAEPEQPALPAAPAPVSTSALTIREDETIAPPLTVLVSANRELPGYNFLITGLVRNDGTENYAGLGMVATYFRADGSRHGPIKTNLRCTLLAPGDMCPFTFEATARGLTEVMLHPEGYPTTRARAQVNHYITGSWVDGIGYVHITGGVTNPNATPVDDAAVSAVLRDGTGDIVSEGTDIVVGTIDPGATGQFEVILKYAPYVSYQLFVQAESR